MGTSNTLSVGSRKIIRCNTCNVPTNHELKAVHLRQQEEEYDLNNPFAQPSWWIDYEYRLWVCLGCETASFEEVETYDDQTDSTFYPSRRGDYLAVKNFFQLDNRLKAIYQEVIESFNAGLRITCAMGLRALLEGICVNKGITDREAFGLEAKLSKLDEAGLLPSNIVKSLHSFKFMGDDAAHRLEAPRHEELKLAIEVMEDLLNFLYEMEYKLASKAKELADKRPAKMAEVNLGKSKKKDISAMSR